MKICPQCNAEYDYDMSFCLQDGTPLQTSEFTPQANDRDEDRTLVLPVTPTLPSETPQTSPASTLRNPTNPQAANPTFKNPADRYQSPPQSAPARSGTGFLLGILITALALTGITAGAGWWYLQSREKTNSASINSNVNNQIIFPDNNSNVNSSTADESADFNKSENLFADSSNTKSPSNINARPSPTVANISRATPTPENKQTVRNEEKPTPKPQIENDEPVPPQPTPDRTLPPPPPKPEPPKKVSLGVINGKATRLVKPSYPAAARMVRASGAVNVQVTIDENGNVISASAVSGHPLLRQASEQAARQSKFTPTVLSGQRVKVTGIIVYNFVAQ